MSTDIEIPVPQPVAQTPRTRVLPAPLVSLVLAAAGVLAGAAAFFGPAALFSQEHGEITRYTLIPMSGLPFGLGTGQSALAMPVWPVVLCVLLLALVYGSAGGRRLAARFAVVGVAVLGAGMIYGQFRDWTATFTGRSSWSEGGSASPDFDEVDNASGEALKDFHLDFGWGTWVLLASLLLLAVAAGTAARRAHFTPSAAPPLPDDGGISVVPDTDNAIWTKPTP